DVVQARAEPAAGDDADARLGGVEEDLAPRAAGLEARQVAHVATPGGDHRRGVVEQHAVGRVHPVVRTAAATHTLAERRVVAAVAEAFDGRVDGADHARPGERCDRPGGPITLRRVLRLLAMVLALIAPAAAHEVAARAPAGAERARLAAPPAPPPG